MTAAPHNVVQLRPADQSLRVTANSVYPPAPMMIDAPYDLDGPTIPRRDMRQDVDGVQPGVLIFAAASALLLMMVVVWALGSWVAI